jgi:hypothetical protein
VFTGSGTPGETVFIVQQPGNTVLGSTTVGAGGGFAVTLPATLGTGDTLSAHSGSAAGPSGGAVTVVPATGGGPATPILGTVDQGASVLTFNGTAGETVTIVGPGGEVLGSTVVQTTGPSSIVLNGPVGAGPLSIVSNGRNEGSVNVSGTPGQPPVVQQGAVLTDGSTITGSGTVGAVIQVVNSDGLLLGSGTVQPDGSFAVPVSGGREGSSIKVLQNGVPVDLAQTAQRLGENRVFLSQNVFRVLQGGHLDIGFKAVADERITVKIFNLAGETVRLVADMEVRAGVLYALRWNGRNDGDETVAAGVYIVSAYGPNTRILKKVVVLK